jgi:hypothetical protein
MNKIYSKIESITGSVITVKQMEYVTETLPKLIQYLVLLLQK